MKKEIILCDNCGKEVSISYKVIFHSGYRSENLHTLEAIYIEKRYPIGKTKIEVKFDEKKYPSLNKEKWLKLFCLPKVELVWDLCDDCFRKMWSGIERLLEGEHNE